MSELARPRVLVVDDHPAMRTGIVAFLAQTCDVVGTAVDGLTALDAIAAFRPDVVVLDVSMPGMNGLEVAERVRQNGLPVRIVFYSAYGDPDIRQAAARVGDAFVLKPNWMELRAAVSGSETT